MANAPIKTVATDVSVDQFIDQLDNLQHQQASRQLCQIMADITGHSPVMWGPSIIGFDQYHYKYESGREGDMPAIAFSPRKANIVLYIASEIPEYQQLLNKLGPHKTGKVCLYLKSLDDIDLDVLRQITKQSYDYVKSRDGQMHRA